MLFNEKVEGHFYSNGQSLKQKTRQIFKVFCEISDVLSESRQRLKVVKET
jgi:hypothetical protein